VAYQNQMMVVVRLLREDHRRTDNRSQRGPERHSLYPLQIDQRDWPWWDVDGYVILLLDKT
jgi:hypothetical protein